jgi:hypothetical protein
MSPIPNGKIGKTKEKNENKAQKQRIIHVHKSLWDIHAQKLNPLIHVSGGTYQ